MKKGSKRHGYQLKNKYKKSLRNNLLKEILLLSKDNVESLSYTLPVLKYEDVLFQDSNNYCDANINNTYSNNEVLISQGYISTAILLLRVIKYSNSNKVILIDTGGIVQFERLSICQLIFQCGLWHPIT